MPVFLRLVGGAMSGLLSPGRSPLVAGPRACSVPDEPSPFFALHDDEGPGADRRHSCLVIGVCGGTASGKTSVCNRILEELAGNGRVVILSQVSRRRSRSRAQFGRARAISFCVFFFFRKRQDSYYRGLTEEEHASAATYNFDHPSAFDWELIEKHLDRLRRKKPIEVPHYDFATHSRTSETTKVYAADVVLFEGILTFAEESVRDLMAMKIFVDTDDDTRLIRRIRRDLAGRGRTLESILTQYETFVKPSFDMHIAPTKKYADVIIPRGETNTVAIALVAQHIKQELTHRGPKFRK